MRRRIRNRKTLLAVVAAAATALALSGGAVAYYSSAGHGSGSASVASPDPLSIAAQTPTANLLYPGGSGELDATVSNPNPISVRINSLVLGSGGIGVDAGALRLRHLRPPLHQPEQRRRRLGRPGARSGRPMGRSTSRSPARSAWTPPPRMRARAQPSRSRWRRAREHGGDSAGGRRWRRSSPSSVSRPAVSYAALGTAGGSLPPRPKITSAPPKMTTLTSATFGYQSKPPVVFLCSLDTGAFTAVRQRNDRIASHTPGSPTARTPSGWRRSSGRPSESPRRRPGRSTRRLRRRLPSGSKPPDFTTLTRREIPVHGRRAQDAVPVPAGRLRLCALRAQQALPQPGEAEPTPFACTPWTRPATRAPPPCTTWVVTPGSATFSVSGGPTGRRAALSGRGCRSVEPRLHQPAFDADHGHERHGDGDRHVRRRLRGGQLQRVAAAAGDADGSGRDDRVAPGSRG